MHDLDPETTKLRLSVPQFCTLLGAVVLATAFVLAALQGIKDEIRAANTRMDRMAANVWTVKDHDTFAWQLKTRNIRVALQVPYAYETRRENPPDP